MEKVVKGDPANLIEGIGRIRAASELQQRQRQGGGSSYLHLSKNERLCGCYRYEPRKLRTNCLGTSAAGGCLLSALG